MAIISLNITEYIWGILKLIYYYYRLSLSLYDRIRRGSNTWIVMLVRLITFTAILIPGWILFVKYFLTSKSIISNIRYSDRPTTRNLLDIYLPTNGTKRNVNVIILSGGGAWVIGYKLWSGLVAIAFAAYGFIVVVRQSL